MRVYLTGWAKLVFEGRWLVNAVVSGFWTVSICAIADFRFFADSRRCSAA